MTLHILTDLVQGSEEWHNARRGMITASVIGQLITPSTLKVANNDQSRSLIWELAAERITGWTEQSYVSADMWRGIDDEPRAVEHYAEHHAPVEHVGFMIRETAEGYRVGFSPDGLVGDDGLIECKSRKPKRQLQTILSNTVPPADMAQVQCGLFVSGRPWCDYISWCGGMPMWPIRVTPDEQWFAAIHAAVEAYEQAARRMAAEYLRATRGLPTTERVTYETDYPELRLS